jgi:hypothetical protein
MTENVRKLIGVAAMAALVVVGVAVSSGDDTNFTRNAAFVKLGDFRQLPEAQQARLAPAFLQQAAPKSLDTGPINKINKEVGPIFKGAKASIQSTGAGSAGIWLQSGGTDALSTGKASVLQGRGVDGKGGTSSYCTGYCMDGKTGKGGTSSLAHAGTASPSYPVLSGRKASFRAGNGMDGVADRIEKCGYVTSAGNDEIATANSLKNVLVSIYVEDKSNVSKNPSGTVEFDSTGYNCQDLQGNDLLPDDASFLAVVNPDSMKPLLLAECMESKVGDVFLNSHIKASAAECVAIVLPALSPDRAIQLGTYWQTQQQLVGTD